MNNETIEIFRNPLRESFQEIENFPTKCGVFTGRRCFPVTVLKWAIGVPCERNSTASRGERA
jgi:hypothetical protein